MRALRTGWIGAAELANYRLVLANPVSRLLAGLSFVRARLLADPRLVSTLGIEIGLGCVLTALADFNARGAKFMGELDFVISNQVLIALTNTALVLALTPSAKLLPSPSSGLGLYFASLPSYVLQAGPYSPLQRLTCFTSKAALFSLVGACTSSAGQGLTMGLIKLRGLIPNSKPAAVELAPISQTAVNYAIFMAASSNTRYQTVNSFEGNVLGLLPRALQVPVSLAVRTFNNYLGSASWIWFAKKRGLQ